MDAMIYITVHANLAKAMDRVCIDHEPFIITRSEEQSVVMFSLEDTIKRWKKQPTFCGHQPMPKGSLWPQPN